MMTKKDYDRIGHSGELAWKRLKKGGRDWGDWLTVGEALTAGRELAMHGANTNRPEGRAYNEQFSQWLVRYGLRDMDKSDRSKLLRIMEHLGEIQEWRQALPTDQPAQAQSSEHRLAALAEGDAGHQAEVDQEAEGCRPQGRERAAARGERGADRCSRDAEAGDHRGGAEALRRVPHRSDLRRVRGGDGDAHGGSGNTSDGDVGKGKRKAEAKTARPWSNSSRTSCSATHGPGGRPSPSLRRRGSDEQAHRRQFSKFERRFSKLSGRSEFEIRA